jgi:hypothetical protein
LDGVRFDSIDRPILVIWSDQRQVGFLTVSDAKVRIEKERRLRNPKADGARIFAWDGKNWKQRNAPSR